MAQFLQRGRGAGRHLRLDAFQLEQGGEKGDDLRIVVHHQHHLARQRLGEGAHGFNSVSKCWSLVSMVSVFGWIFLGA